MGVEPTSKAWEAFILPMNYARKKEQNYCNAKAAPAVNSPILLAAKIEMLSLVRIYDIISFANQTKIFFL